MPLRHLAYSPADGWTTLVVPCFNEARRLPADAFVAFAEEEPSVRYVMVNDGSTDRTPDVLHRIKAAIGDRCRVLDLDVNGGKAEAVRLGILAALEERPAFVGFIDADLSTPLDAVLQMLEVFRRRPQTEIVVGSRVRLLGRQIERRPLRHVCGRVFAAFASHVLGVPIYDTQCGAKVFRVLHATRSLFAEQYVSRWIFDVEILARMRRRARRGESRALEEIVYELPLERWCDVAGSQVRGRDFLRAAGELWSIHRRYSRRNDVIALPTPLGDATIDGRRRNRIGATGSLARC